jgi:hypothetical protein
MVYKARGRGTNPYVNNFKNTGEQNLWNDIVIESIKMFGQDMFYLPKTEVSYDEIYGEDDMTKFEYAYPIEMYIRNTYGFEGEGEFMSNMGLQVQDEVTFTVSKTVFEQEITPPTGQFRPEEGDLVYFPLNKKLFQVAYVNYKPFFYQFGQLQTYDLICRNFTYSNEEIDTGIEEIDELESKYSNSIENYLLLSPTGVSILSEEGKPILVDLYQNAYNDATDDGEELQEEAEDVIDWSETDPFSENGSW